MDPRQQADNTEEVETKEISYETSLASHIYDPVLTIPRVTLSSARSARYSIPPSSSGLNDARSIDFDLLDLSRLMLGVVSPSTNTEETARSIDFALLRLLVSDLRRRDARGHSEPLMVGLIASASSSVGAQLR